MHLPWRLHAFPRIPSRLVVAVLLVLGGLSSAPARAQIEEPVAATARLRYHSPFDVLFVDGVVGAGDALVVVSDRTAAALVGFDADTGERRYELELRGEPTALALGADSRLVYVSEDLAGTVAEVEAQAGRLRRRFEVGRRPMGLAVLPAWGRLVVANSVGHDISVVDLASGRESERVRVPREPFFLSATADGRAAVVGNLLPVGSPGQESLATHVNLVRFAVQEDDVRVARVESIELPPGSTSVREVTVAPDGRWAYVVHTRGRFQVPATQLERGWISTNHLSILDLDAGTLYASVVLDEINRGAADPWGLALAPDGETLWVTLRGVHGLLRIDLARLHHCLAEGLAAAEENEEAADDDDAAPRAGFVSLEPGVWSRIRRDPAQRRLLADDLTALGVAGIVRRFPLPGQGPRGIDISRDGRLLAVAGSFSGDVALLDAATGETRNVLAVGVQPPADAVRRGELLFHDATISLESWLSCSTCHPDRGRNDGLRWDLLNDGLGTPQMTRSLLRSNRVAPTTARGVRADFKTSVTAGFWFLHTAPTDERVADVMAYLSSLREEPSPFLAPDGERTPAQERGRELFEGKGACTRCHRGEIRTDLRPHDIGTAAETEVGGTVFYTPKLLELYRTAPFLHDGRASDLHDIFDRWNPLERHGEAHLLTPEELDDLVGYLLTL